MVEGDDAHRIRLGLSACHEQGGWDHSASLSGVGGGGRNPNTVHLADRAAMLTLPHANKIYPADAKSHPGGSRIVQSLAF